MSAIVSQVSHKSTPFLFLLYLPAVFRVSSQMPSFCCHSELQTALRGAGNLFKKRFKLELLAEITSLSLLG